MTAARTAAARLRGGFVGATSGAVAVGAHSLGGGVPPSGGAVVLLTVACAVVGTLATSAGRDPSSVAAYTVAGQLIGHAVLVLGTGHAHPGHWSLAMVCAHAVAAVLCTALICAAERLWAALEGALRRLVVVVCLPDTGSPGGRPPVWADVVVGSDILVAGGLGTRGPPRVAAAA